MTQAEEAIEIRALTAKIAKIGTETAKSLAKIIALEAAIAAGGPVSDDVVRALDEAKAQAEATDQLTPDEVVEPPTPTPDPTPNPANN